MAMNVGLNNVQQTQQIDPTAVVAAAEQAQKAEETLFDAEQTIAATADVATVQNADLAGATNALKSIGEQLGLTLKGADLCEDLDDIENYVEKLKGMLEQVEKVIEQKTKELEALQKEQEELKEDEAAQLARIDTLNKQIKENNEKQEDLQAQIVETNRKNNQAADEYLAEYNAKFAAASEEYEKDPEKYGDKEAFIRSKVGECSPPSGASVAAMESECESLANKNTTLTTSLNVIQNGTLINVQNKLRTLADKIAVVQEDLETANADKVAIEAEMTTIPAKKAEAIKNSVSPEEWALVGANNVDLSATLADGSPKYMAAKGEKDGKYHIYELTPGASRYGVSLARKYGKAGGQAKGLDIVSWGNGYLYTYKKTGNSSECGGTRVVRFTMNSDCSSADTQDEYAKYTTSSPLSFDLDNNGINTSMHKILFDINGDGKVDEINDVNEGILVFDKDGDGVAGRDGSELFGNNTDLDGDGKADGYKDGFEALKALASKENLINGDDDMELDAKDLKFLSEKYGLAMRVGGYQGKDASFEELGITSINLAKTNETTLIDNFDGKRNQLMKQEGATFVQNGETKDYVDVWNAHKIDE